MSLNQYNSDDWDDLPLQEHEILEVLEIHKRHREKEDYAVKPEKTKRVIRIQRTDGRIH